MSPTHLPSFSARMENTPESFIREILKVSSRPDTISFAGGLPNPSFFPAEKLAVAAEKVFSKDGSSALQYWVTEGYLPLRDYLAEWQSKKKGSKIEAENILMLNGSQQGLDLVGKLFLDPGSSLLLEGPSYLGAIQAFSLYQPDFRHIDISNGGPDPDAFDKAVKQLRPKIFYCVPNFQNPTGNSYDADHRHQLVSIGRRSDTLWVEDNPYEEIYFQKNNLQSFYSSMPERTIYLGSFSKIVSPGMRLGWAIGAREIIRRMSIAKQAADLHSNNLAQRIIYQFLLDNPLEEHLSTIRAFYKCQAEHMLGAMKQHFPEQVKWITPLGGMFIWVTLPREMNAKTLLEHSIVDNVLFVPGENFYFGNIQGKNCLRMNFSHPTKNDITKGIGILGKLIHQLM